MTNIFLTSDYDNFQNLKEKNGIKTMRSKSSQVLKIFPICTFAILVFTEVYSKTKVSCFSNAPEKYSFLGIGYVDFLNNNDQNTFLAAPATPPISSEIDQLAQSNYAGSASYTVGFSRNYHIFKKDTKVQGITAGLTLSYDPVTFNGQVWQYQLSSQNNYSYRYQIRPITVLAESDLIFKKLRCISPFLVFGIGLTEANLTYHETAINGAQPISAQSGSSWQIFPDIAAGTGLLWHFKNSRYFLKTQYLYQYRGQARLSVSTFAQGVPVNLNEQSVNLLFGIKLR